MVSLILSRVAKFGRVTAGDSSGRATLVLGWKETIAISNLTTFLGERRVLKAESRAVVNCSTGSMSPHSIGSESSSSMCEANPVGIEDEATLFIFWCKRVG